MARIRAFPGILLLLLSAPAQSQGPAAAGQQWVLDQADYDCTLATKLAGPPAATLVLRTLPGTGTIDIMLVGERWPGKNLGAREQIAFRFLPAGGRNSAFPERLSSKAKRPSRCGGCPPTSVATLRRRVRSKWTRTVSR